MEITRDVATGTLLIRGAKILAGSFRNFSGAPDKFNPQGGKRYFNVAIEDPEAAQQMVEDGWNVKIRPPREEGDAPFSYLKVAIAFPRPGTKARPLDIIMFNGKGANPLDEETIGLLDGAFITDANVAIRPYHWESAGKTGVAAYLQVLHAKVRDEYFADDFDSMLPADDMPFEA